MLEFFGDRNGPGDFSTVVNKKNSIPTTNPKRLPRK
jgi:hypothetical protein